MLRLVLGSYERLLFGLDVTATEEGFKVTQTFTYPAHISSIKAIAVSANAKYLATGASDEHVKLYSLDKNKESGTLFHHTGSITALAFHDTGYLFTASEDATIAIVRTSDWEPLKKLTGHTTAIQSISIHPTGKLLLSASIDGYLRTWDTAKASCAYTFKLPLPRPVKVCWSKCGLYYAVVFETGVACYQVATGAVLWKTTELGRLVALEFAEINKQPVVIVAGDAKKVVVFNVKKKEVVATFTTPHTTRIKDLSVAFFNNIHILVTCSSDGAIYGWDLEAGIESGDLGNALFTFDAKCRLTCCTAVVQSGGKVKKTLEEEERELDQELKDDDEDEDVAQEVAVKKAPVAKTVAKKGGARVVVSYDGDGTADLTPDVAPVKKGGKGALSSKNKVLQKMFASKQKAIAKKSSQGGVSKKHISKK